MSNAHTVKGIANADLSASQYEAVVKTGSSERIAAATLESQDYIGILQNSDADAAAEQVLIDTQGVTIAVAGAALQPFDLLTAGTDARLKVAQEGDLVVGRYVPVLRSGGTDLPAAAAGDLIRVLLAGVPVRLQGLWSARAVYDFAVDGGTIGTIGSGIFLPDNLVVCQSAIGVETTCITEGSDAGTMAITSTDITVDAAIAVSDGGAPWDAGQREGDHQWDTDTTWEKTTSRQELNFVIATQNFTAGKFTVLLEGFIAG